MNPFSLLIKPASADCNLRCEYCFYLDRSELYPETKKHRMSQEVLERMISSYMALPQQQYTFGWQGGEPTLMGVEFFREAVRLQKKHGRMGAIVANGLQTNATLIDDEFAAHLAKYNFLVGVSIDGPEELHNTYRKNAGGGGSHADVMRGVESLKRNNAEFNVLVLVNKANVRQARRVYRYLCENGIFHHQYIPCVEFDENGELLPFAINGGEWGDFLCELYDLWLPDDTRRVSIRYFDALLSYLVDGVRNICHMGTNCCQYFVVEHNGDIYPCDFFVERHLKVGNITTDSWEALSASKTYREFGAQKAMWNSLCNECEFLEFCAADCLKHRLPAHGSPETLSPLCNGWKQFFRHALPGFRRLAREIIEDRRRIAAARQQQLAHQTKPKQPTVGRNDPCPCGSGKKYKKCCGAKSKG